MSFKQAREGTAPAMSRTKILIAGGGIGGLSMAIMLEHLPEDKKVDYLVLERSNFTNPIGSAISLHASVIPLLKQLGLWEDIERLSKPMSQFTIKREDGSDLGTVDFAYGQYDYSYYGMVLARPDLHDILLSHVPPEKILAGKRIIATSQDDFGVSVHCADRTIYHGDILIGADGAYSGVRQSLYKDLRSHGNLPRQDFSPIKLDQVVVVGVTQPLNPVEYPLLKEDVCQFRIVLGGRERPYTMWMVPLSDNRIAWSIGGRSDVLTGAANWSESQEEASTSYTPPKPDGENEEFFGGGAGGGGGWGRVSRFPDWAEAETESIDAICAQMRHKRNPFGKGTYGDLVDKTPRHLISRVMFEERGFKTWYGGRTVLIGDACHKSVPFGGQGVVNAMFDAACLVNLLHDMPPNPTMDDLGDMFQTYFERRYPAARIAIEGSSQFSRLFNDQAQVEEDGRVVMFNSIPRWLQRWTLEKSHRLDSQLHFIATPSISETPSLHSITAALEAHNGKDDSSLLNSSSSSSAGTTTASSSVIGDGDVNSDRVGDEASSVDDGTDSIIDSCESESVVNLELGKRLDLQDTSLTTAELKAARRLSNNVDTLEKGFRGRSPLATHSIVME